MKELVMLQGKNVEVEVKGDKMIITIDITKEFGNSTSGKSVTVATTGGNKAIALPNGKQVSLGVNCYKAKA
jgi:hypothetical protein